jgi:hypothetical protein
MLARISRLCCRMSDLSPHSPAAHAVPPPAGGKAEDFLWWIVGATSGVTGQEFFDSLVSHLAQALRLKCVMVTECLDYPTTRVRTLANWDSGSLQGNIEYPLEGAPCQETIQTRQVCFYPRGVNEKFPQEIGTDLMSYCGIPIMDAGGRQVIGHFAFLTTSRWRMRCSPTRSSTFSPRAPPPRYSASAPRRRAAATCNCWPTPAASAPPERWPARSPTR